MTELSYQMIRSANQAREADELRNETRKKNLLILVLHYLTEEGYLESADTLSKETNIDLKRHEVCDNVDLATILMEYESYYFVKLGKYPKITKKLTQSAPENDRDRKTRATKLKGLHGKSNSTPALPRIPQNSRPNSPPNAGMRPKSGAIRKPPQAPPRKQVNGSSTNGQDSDQLAMGLKGLCVQGSNSATDISQQGQQPEKAKPKFGQIIDIRAMINDATKLNAEDGGDLGDRLLKPLGGYMGYNSEWRELAQVISRDIFSSNPNVRWDDIIGLGEAKRLVKEAVVYPIKYPQLFTGILSPWKGLLLYGPPGTGKTLLAKAVATECGTTFFNISASSIVSKWRGDSEKLVRVLFELARFYAPSTIFLDELESLMSTRGAGSGEHEGSRRMKTEILVQMDGLAKTEDLVFLLAASNLPWELDHAMLRRLEKRILVDLPTIEARKAMFHHHLPEVVTPAGEGLELLSELDYDSLAEKTEGYSGSDIKLVCKEAAMRPVRKIFHALENHTEGDELHVKLDKVITEDVLTALERTKPSARTLADKYLAWQKEYESV
ncbi:katanin p60 ATPase-containing subunit A-like 2 [Lingula anatina]|uniref:Katanin p60 ATPase-containing subunit A-like 2 n=1 Tax=Lingula anatina TaxID=7574 RepID=A0A1S3H1Z5_LINAN|nr:katanin p60 ATPase-containing subunit A-like 2 [Lingula anatina]|eukprot:XP_013379501.1 katanin p60 ATPase-containing subunit A-like 2 [Lingula anatina]